MNLDKRSMMPRDMRKDSMDFQYVYRYDLNHSSRADSFLGSDRFAVVDLTAGPSEYGAAVSGEGTVTAQTLPRMDQDWSAPVLSGGSGPSSLPFQSRLVQLVRSSVRSLFAPDVLYDELDTSDEVLVAVIVLRNHVKFDPLQPGHEFSIDMGTVRDQVARLAHPEQKINFISGVHNLQEHERIAIAVERSYKTDTLHESAGAGFQTVLRHYIDSTTLFNELRDTSDYLAAGLMDMGSPMHAKFFSAETQDQRPSKGWGGTRVLPVYVLSLMGNGVPLVLDSAGDTFASSEEAVVVLQHADHVMLQYYTNGRQSSMLATNPTSAIIAGVASALVGIVPPSVYFSVEHAQNKVDLLWAHGWSPFGPFANGTYLSQVLADHAIRNGILSRLDVALEKGQKILKAIDEFAETYLFDPLGDALLHGKPNVKFLDKFYQAGDATKGIKTSLQHTKAVSVVKNLHKALLELQADLGKVSKDLYRAHVREAFYSADLALKKASSLEADAHKALQSIAGELECCAVTHMLEPQRDSITWVRAGLVFIVAVCAVVLFTVQDREGGARRRLHNWSMSVPSFQGGLSRGKLARD